MVATTGSSLLGLVSVPPAESSMSDKIEFMKAKLQGRRPENVLRTQFDEEQRALSDKIARLVSSSSNALNQTATVLDGFVTETADLDWTSAARSQTQHLKTAVADLSEVNQQKTATLQETQRQLLAQKARKVALQGSLKQLKQKAAPLVPQAFLQELGSRASTYIATHRT